MRKVIANTTPLIALANIGQLDLFQKLYGEIIIPDAVFEEIKSEPAKSLVAQNSWIKTISVQDDSERKLYSPRLHAGEIEVMMLAKELAADLLIIDDNAAKKTAKFLDFAVTGSLGVLVRAKKEGHIESIKPVVKDLLLDGVYISDRILEMALKAADEK